jgi:hypothetical protein
MEVDLLSKHGVSKEALLIPDRGLDCFVLGFTLEVKNRIVTIPLFHIRRPQLHSRTS